MRAISALLVQLPYHLLRWRLLAAWAYQQRGPQCQHPPRNPYGACYRCSFRRSFHPTLHNVLMPSVYEPKLSSIIWLVVQIQALMATGWSSSDIVEGFCIGVLVGTDQRRRRNRVFQFFIDRKMFEIHLARDGCRGPFFVGGWLQNSPGSSDPGKAMIGAWDQLVWCICLCWLGQLIWQRSCLCIPNYSSIYLFLNILRGLLC